MKPDSYITVLPTPNGFLVAVMMCTNEQEGEYIVTRSWHLKTRAVAIIKAQGMANKLGLEVRGQISATTAV